MAPTPIKATFIRSRQELLNTALKHLSETYYPRLSNNADKSCVYNKYLSTRDGDFLEGAIAFSQDDRKVLISVTPFDLNTFQKRIKWFNPSKIDIPQPDRMFVLIEAFAAALIASVGLAASKDWASAAPLFFVVFASYYAARVIGAEDLGRKLRQSPNVSIYMLLPNFKIPANENWLVVGSELFTQDNRIEPMALVNLCKKEGTGLLVLTQNDKLKVWVHPMHNKQSFERKFNEPIPQLMAS